MRTYIIASPKEWHDDMVDSLQRRFSGDTVVRVRAPQELNHENIQHMNPDFIFFPHWSTHIPSAIYSNFNCIIFHMTDLPYGRGGSPLQNLIIRGHTKTVMSAIKCVHEVDAGPIYAKKPLELDGSANEIFLRASKLIEEMISDIITNTPTPIPQEGEVVTFMRRTPEDSKIETNCSVDDMCDFIRMLDADGYPNAFITHNGFQYSFTKAKKTDEGITAEVCIRKTCNE